MTGSACADEPESKSPQQVVEDSAALYIKAFEARDAEAISSLFTEDAEYVDAEGVVFHGRSTIENELAISFEVSPPGQLSLLLTSIRPIADQVIVEEGVSVFTVKEEGDDEATTSRVPYTATHVRQVDGSWKIASVRELSQAEMSPHDQLQALSWLLGAWHEDVDGMIISTEWKWAENNNFLVGEFEIRRSIGRTLTGTHRIGWDAERRQFRSWIFESNGAAFDGWWRANEDGSWSLDTSGVDAQGVRRSSSTTYARDGDNAIIVILEHQVVDGESRGGSAHRIVRKPPPAKINAAASR